MFINFIDDIAWDCRIAEWCIKKDVEGSGMGTTLALLWTY